MSPQTIQQRIVRSLALVPYARITVRTDVPETIRNYLLERQTAFPGVDVDKTYLRRYPQRELAAQLVGTVGEISPERARAQALPRRRRRARSSARRASSAPTTATCAASTAPRASPSTRSGDRRGRRAADEPVPGRSVRLSLDLDLQQAGEEALQRAIDATPGVAGAFVALDPRDGKVLAMGSNPTFDPSRALAADHRGALRGAVRRGGRLAALQPRDQRPVPDGLDVQAGHRARRPRRGAAHARHADRRRRLRADRRAEALQRRASTAYGTIALRRALQVSSDVYFYTLGRDLNPLERPAAAALGAAPGLRPPRPASTCPASSAAPSPTASGATSATAWRPSAGARRARRLRDRRRHEPPVDRGRQRQPLGRPGRRAGHAAADGRRLRGDRQRRPRRAPAPGRARRGRQRAHHPGASTRRPRGA